eukprot:CAMPEP_0115861942 /NCGR_PEP_ID=MMETSP0287-20121206/17920_1 /TAXON_ID=412157 /ORGANISM="Chrysochromulina rotalis, Strain UIO044" /LENGTH=116 /DNA_ID=CAMNT_0003316347 /DNA_START=59 /DNA_END=409 /DNA_ORIENTATION=-
MSMKFIVTANNEEEWKTKVLAAEPQVLNVVDVYAGWCGPCTGLGKRINNCSGDYIDYDVVFVEALAEKIPGFAEQAGKSRPLIVFYKGGNEIARITRAHGNELARIVAQHAVKKPE